MVALRVDGQEISLQEVLALARARGKLDFLDDAIEAALIRAAAAERGVGEHELRGAVTAGKIEQHFAEHKRSYDAAVISEIIVRDEGVARELRAQARDDGAGFHELAREAEIRRVRRGDVPPEIAAAVFGLQPGEIAGPVRTARGWHVIRVEAVHPATLDEGTRQQIADELFRQFLAERRRRARIEIPLLAE